MRNTWKRRIVAALAAIPMAAAGLVLPATASAADPADGGLSDDHLVAAYDFTGGSVADITGNGHDLTLHGGAKVEKYGDRNNNEALSLRGGSQYAELPRGLFDGMDSFTLEFASKSRAKDGDNFFTFSIGEDNQRYFFSRIRPSSMYTAITTGSNGAEQGVTVNGVGGDYWHTYRISVSPTMIAVFVDGEMRGITTDVHDTVSDLGTNLKATFGQSTWGPDKYYDGGIDDVKLWNVTYLTDDMVWDGVSVPGSTEGDLTLPATDALGDVISWKSGDPDVLADDGTVVRNPARDTDVTLTATVVASNGATYTKDFTVTVAAAISTAGQAADRLLVDYELAAGAALPTSIPGAPDATVSWTSSDTALVGDDGTVKGTDGKKAKTVDLTATVALGDTTEIKTFTGVRVMPKDASTLASYTRDGSVNGGSRVGNALHLALSADGKDYEALNQNYGVAFAEANYIVDEEHRTIDTSSDQVGRGIADPYLFRMKDGRYAFVSVLTRYNATRGQDSKSEELRTDPGQILFLASDNLYQWQDSPNDYEVAGRVRVTDDTTPFDKGSLNAGWDASAGVYRVGWTVNGAAKYVTTKDFRTFSAVHNGPSFARTTPDLDGIDHAQAGNAMPLEAGDASALAERLGRVTNTAVDGPKKVTVAKGSDRDDLLRTVTGADADGTPVVLDNGDWSKGAAATATYSDGSTFDFRVNWDRDELDAIDLAKDGTYTIHGTINQQNYSEQFPMMENRADPNIVFWKGRYYAMGTSDAGGMQALFIRSSDTLAGLKDRQKGHQAEGGWKVEGQDTYLFGPNDGFGHSGYHWAPELHVITDSDGVDHLYCFLATYPTGRDGDAALSGAPNWAGPSAYVYELTGEDQDPTKTSNWTEHRVLNRKGTELNLKALTIDMTYFEVKGQPYVAWSQGDDTYAGARAGLYIAKTTKDKPWQIVSDAVRLVQPVYGWELSGVSEGPNVLVSGGKVYMVFSAQEVSPQYATGMMIADADAKDLTDPDAWTKSNYPWLKNGTFANQQGLGHNSYFTDPYGDTYNVYHALLNGTGSRHAGILPVHFRSDGTPIIDMTTSEELDQSKKDVTLTVQVGKGGEIDPTPEAGDPLLHYSLDARPADGRTLPNEGTAKDADATLAGSGTTFADGQARFDGNGSVTVPTKALDGKENVTVSLWLRNHSGSTNTAAAYIGAARTDGSQYPTRGYWLLNPANPNGYVKSVMTTATADAPNGNPWNTEVGPGNTGTPAEGGARATDDMAMYTAVINGAKGTMTVYLDGSRLGDYDIPDGGLTAYGDLVASIATSPYPDPNAKVDVADYSVYDDALTGTQVRDLHARGLLDRAAEEVSVPKTAYDDFDLPAAASNGASITWKVTDGTSVTIDGDTARLDRGEADAGRATATLEATFAHDGTAMTRTYTVVVATTDEVFDHAIDGFGPGLSAAEKDFRLPDDAGDGIAVTWKVKQGSKGLAVDGDTATVTRTADDQKATLVAEFTLDGRTRSKEYPIRVIGNGGALATYPRGTDKGDIANSRSQAVTIAVADSLRDVYTPLNDGRPVLYPDYDTKQYARLSTAVTFRMADGSFGIVGGDANSPSNWIWFFTTKDFIHFDRSVDKYGTGLTGSVLPVEVTYDNLTGLYTMVYRDRAAEGEVYYRATTKDFQPGSWSKAERDDSLFASLLPDGLQDDAMNPHTITISASERKALERRYSRIVNTTLGLTSSSASVKAGSTDDVRDLLQDVRATAGYTDGSTKSFKVNWDEDSLRNVDLSKKGTYEVKGTVNQPTYSAPLVRERADPDATYVPETGEYYLTGSYPMCDNSDKEGYDRIVLRHATTLDGLTTDADRDPDYDGHVCQVADNETTIWDESSVDGAGRYVWAPELERIGDTYYVLFTASTSESDVWGIRPMMLRFDGDLKAGDSLTDADKWTFLGRVKAADGDDMAFTHFSLDMTHFTAAGKDYLAWAEKPGNTSTIRVAQIDPKDPTQLISQSIMVTTPEMVWERQDQNGNDVIVNEGPAALVHDGTVYLFFSSAAVDKSYCISYLTIDEDGDILDPDAWYKNTYPVLGADDFDDRMGTGHNSFTIDENGNPVIVYHARLNSEPIDPSGGELVNGGLWDPRRHAFVKTVHFAADGHVVLNQTADEEITPDNRAKELTFTIEVTGEDKPTPEPSADATLASLTVAGQPVNLEAAASQDGATVKVDDPSAVTADSVEVKTRDAKAKAEVAVKDGTVTVKVTAEDGKTAMTYMVHLEQASEESTPEPEPEPEPTPTPEPGPGEGVGTGSGTGAGTGTGAETGDGQDKEHAGTKPTAPTLTATGADVSALALAAVALLAAGIALALRRRRV